MAPHVLQTGPISTLHSVFCRPELPFPLHQFLVLVMREISCALICSFIFKHALCSQVFSNVFVQCHRVFVNVDWTFTDKAKNSLAVVAKGIRLFAN